MKRILIGSLAALALAGCGTNKTITWAVSNVVAVNDTCDIHDPGDPLSGNFIVTINGSEVTIDHETLDNLSGTTNDFKETDDVVVLSGSSENIDYPPCTAGLEEQFTLTLDQPTLNLENNDSITVTWDHNETDISATADACAGVWFVDLPCSSQLTFTLTKVE